MFAYIFTIIECFKSVFSRRASFSWFATLVIGFLLRSDKLGITSVVRDLSLRPSSYLSMLNFFRAESWDLCKVRERWYHAILNHIPLFREDGYILLAADGVKQSKEARRMPAVKRLRQESETQSKPEIIFGHMWGCVGVLAGVAKSLVCVPASLRIHDGMREAAAWEGSDISDESHVVQTVRNCCELAGHIGGKAIALMDRYFLSVPALVTLNEENERHGCTLELVAKAKKSLIAYRKPEPRKPGQKGRPRLKGEAVKLSSLFEKMASSFKSAVVEMYGKQEEISYYCIDLLWGQKLYHPLRFVLVKFGQTQSIFASTCLELNPLTIIRLYSYRFRIEHTFRELKQQMGCFAYRFWSKVMPKLSHFRKKDEPQPLSEIKDTASRAKILKAFRAIEMHALVSSIAIGILQGISLKWPGSLTEYLRWQRTPCKNRPSEANVMHVLRCRFFAGLAKSRLNCIMRFIREHQIEALYGGEFLSA